MSIRFRSTIRRVADAKTFEIFVSALERLDANANLLRVLTYHRVDELESRPHLAPCTLSATPESFSRQMAFLAENYHVLSLEELLHLRKERSRLPARAVMVTFDDAYRDFSEHARPILERYQLPATLFVPTAYPDQSKRVFWWDRLYQAIMEAPPATYDLPGGSSVELGDQDHRESVYRRLSDDIAALEYGNANDWMDHICDMLGASPAKSAVLSWKELRALADVRLSLAPHTRTHPLLNRVNKVQAREEILGSMEDLQREIGETPRVFAYPGGALTSEVVALLREEGFELAFTTQRGIIDWGRSDPLRLNRINVGYRCPFGLWRGQLLGISRYLQRN